MLNNDNRFFYDNVPLTTKECVQASSNNGNPVTVSGPVSEVVSLSGFAAAGMQGPIPLHAYADRDVDADASSGGSGSTCTAGGTVTIYKSDILREFPGTFDSSGASNPPEGWTEVVSSTVCASHKKGEEVLQNRFIPRDWDKGYYAAEITCVHGDGSNGITFINNIPCISVFINREDL